MLKHKSSVSSNIPPEPAPKRRGRPLSNPSDPSTNLQRARVRRAQKAFRTRKDQHLAQLEEKCKTLENVVEEMTSTFLKFSDGLLSSTISRGDERVGSEKVNVNLDSYVKRELKGTMERFLELGRKAAMESGEEEEEEEEEEGGREDMDEDGQMSQDSHVINVQDLPRTDGSNPNALEFSESRRHTSKPYGTLESSSLRPTTANSLNLSYAAKLPVLSQQNANPYLNNIWASPPASRSDVSTIPYILAGRDSFAARLYFSIISSMVHSFRDSYSPGPATSFFRYKARYVPQNHSQAIIEGVLDMLLYGTSQVRSIDGGVLAIGPGDGQYNDSVSEMRVKEAILKEVEQEGMKEEEYMATWGVESYLRTKWRLVIDSKTVRVRGRGTSAFSGFQVERLGRGGSSGSRDEQQTVVMGAPTMIPGFEHSSQKIWDADGLVERLLDVAVSIGEGPRWHYKQIDSVVEAFLNENRTRDY
ncbi:hypothetical protein VTL71DRAFT_12927 [Oculimacula yallundae]|uniref:BZIP domain-containing protein n=1 Tax=Oculimacula yallundae TaxID=86028 RepID=A0ABR4CNV5_9HELO